MTLVRRGARLWRQLPFVAWLVALWMLLWGQATVLSLLTGVVAAIVVTRLFRLPPVEVSGRVNLWHACVLGVAFALALVRGSLTVAGQVLDIRRRPSAAIIAVPLRTDDDLMMTHTAVVASLIPGSLVVEADRSRRILYLHVIGVRTPQRLEAHRQDVREWERRLVLAIGSRAQLARLRGPERERGRA